MKSFFILAAAAGLLLAVTASADVIYGWKDDQGVQHFSLDPPPQDIVNFKKFEFHIPPPGAPNSSGERRPSYDEMVQRAIEEARQLEQQREAEAAARAAEKERLAEAQRRDEIQAERSRLEAKIEALNNRALSPTFSQGMRQAQIDQIQKQIEALEKGPDAVKAGEQEPATQSKDGD